MIRNKCDISHVCHVSNSLIMSLQKSSLDEEADVDHGLQGRQRVRLTRTISLKAFCVHLEDQSGNLKCYGQDVSDVSQYQGPRTGEGSQGQG